MKVFINSIIILLFLNNNFFPSRLAADRWRSTNKLLAATNQKTVKIDADPLIVRKCADFKLTGRGDEVEWKKAKLNLLTKLDSGGNNYKTCFKILYSEKGIYVLFNAEDEKITTQENQDFAAIYNGDAFEVFFHPNPQSPKYFEFEINQFNKVLILMISRKSDRGYDWIPWHYENGKQMTTQVDVVGGKVEQGEPIRSWWAEGFFPFGILDLMDNVPPIAGTIWNANFCRLDYDSGQMIKWSWSPNIKNSFHELEKFRSIKFE